MPLPPLATSAAAAEPAHMLISYFSDYNKSKIHFALPSITIYTVDKLQVNDIDHLNFHNHITNNCSYHKKQQYLT